MTVDKPSHLIPKLRFPEFCNAPEWEEKKLGEVSEVLMCKRIFASETNPNRGVPFYKIGTLGGVPDAFISKTLFEEYKSKYNFPRIGEILITCSGTIGKCLPYDGSEAYFQDSNIVWIDNSTLEVSNEFLLNILSNVNWSTLNSTTITRIYGPDLRGLGIKFPKSKREQKRIADCLCSLDDLIAAECRKLKALRQHKQGLIQQLFPLPGETLPRLRFPKFEEAPEWEEKRLSSLVELVSGVHLAPDMYSKAGEVPYFTGPSDFTGDIQCVSKWTHESANTAKQHDTLITVKGSGVGEIWYLTLPSVAMGRQLMAVRTEIGDSRFIYQFLSTRRAQFKALASGNLIPGLSRGDILDMVACFPCRDEQQRIAGCLTAIDGRLDAQARKLDTLKQHKQGLLQQLFPSPEGSE